MFAENDELGPDASGLNQHHNSVTMEKTDYDYDNYDWNDAGGDEDGDEDEESTCGGFT